MLVDSMYFGWSDIPHPLLPNAARKGKMLPTLYQPT